MTDTSAVNGRRVAKNTLMLYVRMLVMMAVTLYASRVLMRVLGVTDLGIYNVVGGAVALLGFISSSMAISVQRFLAYDLGKHDTDRLNLTLNIAVIIHVVIALTVWLVGESLGLWLVAKYLNLPAGRYDAAMIVYHMSVLAACVKMLQVPFNALIIATERMSLFAYLSIGEALLSLGCALALPWISYDHLIVYGGLTLGMTVCVAMLYAFCSLRTIEGVRLRWCWDKEIFRRLTSFAFWSALGEMSWGATIQGVNIVLNIFFGPAVNAARGIAYQVLNAVTRFAQNFQMAMNPQIIKQYAAGNLTEMETLMMRGTRLSFYLLLFLMSPLLLRTHYVLALWLGRVPDYLEIFTRLILINALLDALSNLTTTVVKAYGRIRNYQIIVSFVLFLNLPFSYLLIKAGLPPESSFWVYGLVSLSLLAVRLYFVKQMVGLSVRRFVRGVLVPVLFTSVVVALPLGLVNLYIADTLGGLVAVILISCLWCLIAIPLAGLTRGERIAIGTKALALLRSRVRRH